MAGVGDGVVAMEPGVGAALGRKFAGHREGLRGTRADLREVVELLDAGTGEFVPVMSLASGTFGASWEEAAVQVALSAETIGETAAQFEQGLAEVDARGANE